MKHLSRGDCNRLILVGISICAVIGTFGQNDAAKAVGFGGAAFGIMRAFTQEDEEVSREPKVTVEHPTATAVNPKPRPTSPTKKAVVHVSQPESPFEFELEELVNAPRPTAAARATDVRTTSTAGQIEEIEF